MEARDIERYLADLGAALKNRGVKKPLRMMLIGGAYMLLLENAPRSTEDIDIFWLEEDAFERMRELLSACMLEVARKHMLPPNWFNFLTQVILMIALYSFRKPLFKRSSKHRNCSIHTFSPKRKKNTVNRLRSRSTFFFRGT